MSASVSALGRAIPQEASARVAQEATKIGIPRLNTVEAFRRRLAITKKSECLSTALPCGTETVDPPERSPAGRACKGTEYERASPPPNHRVVRHSNSWRISMLAFARLEKLALRRRAMIKRSARSNL